LEALFHFSTGIRAFLFWGTISTLSSTLIYFTVNYFLKRTGALKPFDTISYSQKVGNKFTGIKDSLTNSLSLFKSNQSASVFSNDLIAANLENIDKRSRGINFSSFIPFKFLKKLSIVLVASFVFYSICFAIFPDTMFGSLKRLVNYQYNFINGEYGIIFEIEPGDTEVVKGERVDVSILVKANKEGLDIKNLKFYTKELKRDGTEILLNEKELETSVNGYFLTTIESVNTDLIYYAEYEGVESDRYEIKILDYPIIKSFKVTIHPPEFTGMPVRELKENEGDVFCPEGSRLDFEITSSRDLSFAGIELNGNLNSFNVNSDKASGSVTVSNSGTYKFVLKDNEGRENRNSKIYNIKVVNDAPPKIVIIEPKESNYTLKGEKELIVRARISDDFGFSKLTLHYSKTNGQTSASGNYTIINIPIKNLDATSLEVPYLWSIAGLRLSSGEKVEYYMEVTDNTGKTARSDIRILQYKSLTELLKESEKLAKELKSDLESVSEDAYDLQKKLLDLKRKSQMNEELGLNEQQKQELKEQVDNVQKNLDATQNKINQSIDQMKQNNLSDKTLEQYMKMQELFSKINTPELQEMLKKLKEALQKNNKDEIRDAMKNFNFDEEAFKKNLEKIMEMMKKIEALQDFGKLTEKLDELTKDQDKLKEETKQTDGNDKNKLDELSDKQKDIKSQTDEFKEALKDLIEKMKQMKDNDMSPQDLQKLIDQMNKMNPQNKMQDSQDQLQKGQKQNSEKTQDNISKDLNELNKQMQDALEKQLSAMDMNSKMMDKMNGIKEKLEELSKKQQDLKDRTEDLSQSDKNEMKETGKQQQGLQQDLSEQINDLMNMSKSGAPLTPELGKELGKSYNKMDKAGENLEKGNKKDASDNQGDAKQSLDNAIKMLSDMMGKMQQPGKNGQPGPGKMGQLMQQLADIIGQQQGLNGKMGQFGENGTGKEGKNGKEGKDGLTPQQKEQMQRLQLEQEQLSKSLEQLNKELEEEKKNSGEKVLGDLNEIKKEMQEVIKDLQNQNITDKTLEKQNRILSRLLDAQLSQREKDFEQKRESRPGVNYNRTSPPEIVLSGPKSFNALKEEFLKLQKEGYTEDYEELITKYLLELRKNGYIEE
jgi:DNA repair exonuclease SbcCD ATPase subunit